VFPDTNPDGSDSGTAPVVTRSDVPRGFGGDAAVPVGHPDRDLSSAARDVAALVATERDAVAFRGGLAGRPVPAGGSPGPLLAGRLAGAPPSVVPAIAGAPDPAGDGPSVAGAGTGVPSPPPLMPRAPREPAAGVPAVEPAAGEPTAAESTAAEPTAADRVPADRVPAEPVVADLPADPEALAAPPAAAPAGPRLDEPRPDEPARPDAPPPAASAPGTAVLPDGGGPITVRDVVAPTVGQEADPSPELTFGGTPAARVALVTGAGRGIGRAIALGLAEAGLSVALLGRSPGALEDVAGQVAAHGVGASWAGADVRDFAQVHNAVERLEAALGDIDLLINNAGVIEPVEVPVWDAGPETWWHVVETDLRGPFHCVRAVVPGMVERGGGRVINLSAGGNDRDHYSAYSAAKAGLFRITGSLHLAGYERGLRAFEISPGTVRTDMTTTMAAHTGRTEWTPVRRVVDLVVAAAAGRLDAWSGAFLHAGVDTPEILDQGELTAGEAGLPPWARRLGVLPYGPQDPLATSDGD